LPELTREIPTAYSIAAANPDAGVQLRASAPGGVGLKQTQRGILHQPGGIRAFLDGDLRKLLFLLRV